MTGATTANSPATLEDKEIPLLYLVFEICEVLFDLTQHCCMSGKGLGIKLALCPNPSASLDSGTSTAARISSPGFAADLIISLASVSNHPSGQVNGEGANLPVNRLSQSP
jgi:hypothetical protein